MDGIADQTAEVIRILKARLADMSDEPKTNDPPMPAPVVPVVPDTPRVVVNNGPTLLTLIVAFSVSSLVTAALAVGGFAYLRSDKTPPTPSPVTETKIDPADCVVLHNGKRLSAAKAKPIIDVVNQGVGNYLVRCSPVDGDEITRTVVVSGVSPVPPGPGPTPPGPTPDPAPIPSDQLRVLFVYETGDAQSREQLNIINSTAIRNYLKDKCVKDDGLPGFRFWDKDIDTAKESDTWKKIWETTKPKLPTLPAVVVFRGTVGEYYPLPSTEAATLDFLKKFGGQ